MTGFAEGLDALLAQEAPLVSPAIQLAIRRHGQVIYQGCAGWLDPETRRRPVNDDTLFDLASLTKLFTTTGFMLLVEAGRAALDQPVSTVLPEFSGQRPIQAYEDPLHWGQMVSPIENQPAFVDASQVTFRHLLTHTSGLPAWRPFKDQPDAPAARRLALETFFAYAPGTRVLYSDVGLILLGMAVERLAQMPLERWIDEQITAPLHLANTRFFPLTAGVVPEDPGNVAPTEFCRWRGRRIVGEVHDESASRLGGIAGHAGLFANAADLAAFGQMFLDGGHPLLRRETVSEMVREQAASDENRRGLGFHLWSPDPEASSNPFCPQTFGHTGFTGTSLWIDPRRALVVALLTNEVYYGRDDRKIGVLRLRVHHAIVSALDELTATDSEEAGLTAVS